MHSFMCAYLLTRNLGYFDKKHTIFIYYGLCCIHKINVKLLYVLLTSLCDVLFVIINLYNKIISDSQKHGVIYLHMYISDFFLLSKCEKIPFIWINIREFKCFTISSSPISVYFIFAKYKFYNNEFIKKFLVLIYKYLLMRNV